MGNFSLIGRDQSGAVSYLMPPTDYKYFAALSSASDTALQLPAAFNRWDVIITYSPSTEVWVAIDETAEAPTEGSFISTTSYLNWQGFPFLKANTVIHFYTTQSNVNVGVYLYPRMNEN